MDRDYEDWTENLAETLANDGHGLAVITLARYRDTAGRDKILETARGIADAAGWHIHEISAPLVSKYLYELPTQGFLILRDVDVPLPHGASLVPALFQLMVQKGYPVALFIVGTVPGIRALLRHPGLGFLSRSEFVTQPSDEGNHAPPADAPERRP
ncbi:hypothetical protein [Arthrobacter sp. PAMC25284]|uniref:hypothetical protein n=1 Tax=Arthrobacter sp. PAMC25284 TaxID=2861279 RepID=UPI001C628741|nr:hypothetical protein [Arthrobacter sp. PAMC25284]QYF88478.1 hypothetical protein KY499_09260 [Arthrobacter sp. PAMC25284]